MKFKYIFLFISIIIIAYSGLISQELLHPYNLDFEEGRKGSLPIGWTVPQFAQNVGYTAFLSDSTPQKGRFCLELENNGKYEEGIYGSVMQTIDAKPFRGKKIRFRAAVRIEIDGPKGSAHLWVRTHLDDKTEGFFNFMEDRPIVLSNWEYFQIEGMIDDNAEFINYGLLMYGIGRAWLDDASFEILPTDTNYEAPMPLTAQAVENLAAFAKLYGLARYFNPSTEAKEVNWERFALAGVYNLEQVKSKNELADMLHKLFAPIAPGISIFDASELNTHSEKFMNKPEDALNNISLSMKHIGPSVNMESVIFGSSIVNVYLPQRESEGVVYQIIDASQLRGRKIAFSCNIRGSFYVHYSKAQLWLRIDCPNDSIVAALKADCPKVENDKWNQCILEAEIPDSATFIRVGLALYGEGKLFFDDCSVKAVNSPDSNSSNQLANDSFESNYFGGGFRTWKTGDGLESAGYTAIITDSLALGGKNSLCLASFQSSMLALPQPGELFTCELPGGLVTKFPISLYVDSVRTLPHTELPPLMLTGKSPEFILSGMDRPSRLAITIIAWNIFRQFSLFPQVPKKWDETLFSALKKAATAQDEQEFLSTLEMLAVPLEDSHARVWLRNDIQPFVFPFLWELIGDKVYISKVMPGIENIRVGDEIEQLDGIPVTKLLEVNLPYISGSTNQWKKLRAAALLRSSPVQTNAILSLRDRNGISRTEKTARNIKLGELTEDKLSPLSELEPGYYYIDMTYISDKVFKSMVKKISEAKGIIFDFRGPAMISEHFFGFFIKNSVKTAEWLVPVFTFPDKTAVSNKIIRGTITAKTPTIAAKLAFLCDSRSNGYSVALLHIAQFYGLGTIVGEECGGNATEVMAFNLPGDYHVSMSAMQSVSPEGLPWKSDSLPEVIIRRQPGDLLTGRDAALEKALDILKSR